MLQTTEALIATAITDMKLVEKNIATYILVLINLAKWLSYVLCRPMFGYYVNPANIIWT